MTAYPVIWFSTLSGVPFLGSRAGSIPRNRLYENYCACGRRSYISPRGDVVPFFRGHPASPGPLDDVCLKA